MGLQPPIDSARKLLGRSSAHEWRIEKGMTIGSRYCSSTSRYLWLLLNISKLNETDQFSILKLLGTQPKKLPAMDGNEPRNSSLTNFAENLQKKFKEHTKEFTFLAVNIDPNESFEYSGVFDTKT